nr:MAG TPA: hypothetical protein [Caudoviricetes sp.]
MRSPPCSHYTIICYNRKRTNTTTKTPLTLCKMSIDNNR